MWTPVTKQSSVALSCMVRCMKVIGVPWCADFLMQSFMNIRAAWRLFMGSCTLPGIQPNGAAGFLEPLGETAMYKL